MHREHARTVRPPSSYNCSTALSLGQIQLACAKNPAAPAVARYRDDQQRSIAIRRQRILRRYAPIIRVPVTESKTTVAVAGSPAPVISAVLRSMLAPTTAVTMPQRHFLDLRGIAGRTVCV